MATIYRNPILQSFINECADRMREKVGEPDIDEGGRRSFLQKEWSEEDEREFLNWASDRMNSDHELWRTFSPYPHRKKYVEKVIDSLVMYTPKISRNGT